MQVQLKVDAGGGSAELELNLLALRNLISYLIQQRKVAAIQAFGDAQDRGEALYLQSNSWCQCSESAV